MAAPQRILLDACVLFPTVMREVLLAVARRGLFAPLWSARILEEWARAASKIGPPGPMQARAEIALLRAHWPAAEVAQVPEEQMRRLWLPDANDVHVLAAAVAGHADAILTVNTKDFPKHILAEEGLDRLSPDPFLYGLWLEAPDAVSAACAEVLEQARKIDGAPVEMRALLKRARLPRLAKAVG